MIKDRITKGGYIWIKAKNHPHADKNGYYMEHRLVVERYLQRFLKTEEVVHHLDGNKSDNELDNLMLFSTQKAHASFHTKMKRMGYLTNPMKKQIMNRWDEFIGPNKTRSVAMGQG